MLVSHIGNIEFTRKMWWKEFNETDVVIAETQNTIDGGQIVYELAKQTNAKIITLESQAYQWQTVAVKDAIMTMARASIGTQTTITTKSGDIIDVRFAHENGGAMFERVVPDTEINKWYKGTINLVRV